MMGLAFRRTVVVLFLCQILSHFFGNSTHLGELDGNLGMTSISLDEGILYEGDLHLSDSFDDDQPLSDDSIDDDDDSAALEPSQDPTVII